MAQKRFDWVVGEWNVFDEAQGGVIPSGRLGDWNLGSAVAFHIVSQADLQAKSDRLRVERVIGQVFMRFGIRVGSSPAVLPQGSGVFIAERIYVVEAIGPSAGGSTTGTAQDLLASAAFEDADRSFLWHRARVLDIGGAGANAGDTWINANQQAAFEAAMPTPTPSNDGSLGYSGIDVRVKRVLTGREILVYQVQFEPWIPGVDLDAAAAAGFTMNLDVWPFLRVGVKF